MSEFKKEWKNLFRRYRTRLNKQFQKNKDKLKEIDNKFEKEKDDVWRKYFPEDEKALVGYKILNKMNNEKKK